MRTFQSDRILLLLFLALLIGLGVWIQRWLTTEGVTSKISGNQHQSDYFVKNFVVRGNEVSGVAYILMGDHLEHFPNDQIIEIKRPCLLLPRQDDAPQLIFGEEGRVIQNGAIVVLRGNVKVLEKLPENITESVYFSSRLLSQLCFSSNAPEGSWTRTDELQLRLKPSLNY